MNKVYLSGIVSKPPVPVGPQEVTTHAAFHLCVSHKTSKGEWRRELYHINSWNAAARWVLQNLKQGPAHSACRVSDTAYAANQRRRVYQRGGHIAGVSAHGGYTPGKRNDT